MSVFTVCINWGETLREKGEPDEALALLEFARDVATSRSDRALAWAHIGLTHWRKSQNARVGQAELVRLAEHAFEVSLGNARASQNRARTIEVQRHIARMRLDMGDLVEAYRLGFDALGHAKESGRLDLVWFTHLVTLVQIKRHKSGELPWSVPVHWIRREVMDYLHSGVHDSNEVAKRAWRKGIMKSHQEMYGVLLAPVYLLNHYLRARARLMRVRTVPVG